jgi:hypothetical protein
MRMVHNDSGFIGTAAPFYYPTHPLPPPFPPPHLPPRVNVPIAGPVNLGNPNEFTVKELAQMVRFFSVPPLEFQLFNNGLQVLELIPSSTSSIVFLPCPHDDPTQRKPDITGTRFFESHFLFCAPPAPPCCRRVTLLSQLPAQSWAGPLWSRSRR